MSATGRAAIFGSFVLAAAEGAASVLRDRWVVTEGSRIAAITADRPDAADIVFDAPGRFVLPGLLNLHNHCFSEAIARTHTEDGAARRNDRSIVHTVLLPLSLRGLDILTPAERLAIARLGILQLLKGGSTTVMEPFRNGIAEMFDAALEMGLRFHGAPYLFAAADLAVWDRLHAAWEGRDNGRIRLVMSPHATDTCEPDVLRAAAARARALGVPITTHMAQSAAEVATIRARHGRTPVEYLDWLGVLGPDLLAAHGIACTPDDLRLFASRDATMVNCPRVFARSGTTASFAYFAAHGVRTLVGTDGYNMDLVGELNAAAIISKIASADATVATAPQLIAAVTSQAAAAIGRPDLGIIRPGAAADLTVVDLSHPHLQPLADPCRALVWLANRGDIDTVMVAGKLLVAGGRYLHGDEAAIAAAGAAAVQRIWDLPEAQAAFAN